MSKDSKPLVRYHNNLNMVQLGKMPATCQDLFMALCYELRNKGTDAIDIPFSRIRQLSNYKANGNDRLREDLIKTSKELLSMAGILETKKSIKLFNFFSEFEFVKDDNLLRVRVTPTFSYLINDLTKGFTKFTLSESVNLTSRHSKTLYRLLKQFSSTGTYSADIDNLKYLFGVDQNNMQNKVFIRDVIKPATAEILPFFPELAFKYNKAADGRTINGLQFSFKAS